MNPMTPSNQIKVRTGMLIGKATVYGAEWCGFTTKQKEAFTAKGIDFDYVECGDGQCPGIEAFPVVKDYPNVGDSWTGFKALS